MDLGCVSINSVRAIQTIWSKGQTGDSNGNVEWSRTEFTVFFGDNVIEGYLDWNGNIMVKPQWVIVESNFILNNVHENKLDVNRKNGQHTTVVW